MDHHAKQMWTTFCPFLSLISCVQPHLSIRGGSAGGNLYLPLNTVEASGQISSVPDWHLDLVKICRSNMCCLSMLVILTAAHPEGDDPCYRGGAEAAGEDAVCA
jgi:hypothetical protein